MNDDRFKNQISTLSRSGAGVIFVRSREPQRAVAALMEYTSGKQVPFASWDIVRGWRNYVSGEVDPHNDVENERARVIDAFAALKWIMDVDGGGRNKRPAGVFVMSGMHPWLDKHPGIIELLRQYVAQLAETRNYRLILVTPECGKLPEELSHDIPMVEFDLPTPEEIEQIFDYVMDSCYGSAPEEERTPTFTPEQKSMVVSSAGGLTQMEVELSFSRGFVENTPVGGNWRDVTFDRFNSTVLGVKTEVVRQSEVLELMKPVVMDEVGGLDLLKEWIEIAKSTFTQEARDFGCDVPAGIAAIGPPGTGKSLIAKAVASTLGVPLIKFDVGRCFGSLVGQSEERVRSALKQLEAMGKVVVLFDEVDKSLGGSHTGGGDSGVSKRVLGSILTFMQETEAPIFPIYTANRVDGLPPELLRKGRLDEVFSVMPPNRIEREAIFRIHLKKRRQDPSMDLAEAVRASRGYVSSELEGAVSEAVKVAHYRKTEVNSSLIVEMLGNMKPISVAFEADFRRMTEWAENNARPASPHLEEENDWGQPSAPVRKRERGVTAN